VAETEAEEAAEEASESSEGMRFMSSEAEVESESENEDYPLAYPLPDGSVVDYDTDEVANDPHVPSKRDNWLSNGVIQPQKVPWKPTDPQTAETQAEETRAAAAEEAELSSPNTLDATVMRESTNTMTQSARCLMYCANGYGLCTRENQKGCACAAGCQCNRGEAEATCMEHCHPHNQMYFVYGYHDANHFSPHFWHKSIGDVLDHYDMVRSCFDGCQKRGKCRARFCPRHPSGGYKCKECKRLTHTFRPRRGRKTGRYYVVPRPSRGNGRVPMRAVVHMQNHGIVTDEWGHYVGEHNHAHVHAYPEHWFPRWQETSAEVTSEAEAEAEAETGSEAEAGSEMEVHMEEGASHAVEAEAATESESAAESEAEYVNVAQTPYATAVAASATNIRRTRPRVVKAQRTRPMNDEDMADNGIVDSVTPQDPLAGRDFDCNFYDCTGMSSEPHVKPGSLNPAVPWKNPGEARTTTFGTVPDMLEPRSEVKIVYADN